MSLWDGLRLYPKAVFWSMAVSMTLVMEGFDTNSECPVHGSG
jgi:SP family general alpha glucoside:H+ symporter-like MFS transporter